MMTNTKTAQEPPLLLLNAAVLTAFGSFTHRPVSLAEARSLVQNHRWRSAVGHSATAQLLSELLEVDCPCVRVRVEQTVGQKALVFRLNQRQAVGADLGEADMQSIGYHLTLIERVA